MQDKYLCDIAAGTLTPHRNGQGDSRTAVPDMQLALTYVAAEQATTKGSKKNNVFVNIMSASGNGHQVSVGDKPSKTAMATLVVSGYTSGKTSNKLTAKDAESLTSFLNGYLSSDQNMPAVWDGDLAFASTLALQTISWLEEFYGTLTTAASATTTGRTKPTARSTAKKPARSTARKTKPAAKKAKPAAKKTGTKKTTARKTSTKKATTRKATTKTTTARKTTTKKASGRKPATTKTPRKTKTDTNKPKAKRGRPPKQAKESRDVSANMDQLKPVSEPPQPAVPPNLNGSKVDRKTPLAGPIAGNETQQPQLTPAGMGV